ncbi:hypothetical protein B0H14DRAFT_3456061 [Mycena olivaceomarginata]|nr:hypothetical protein B0H14DRAFT_3456061 [Mycena olivaceomarginata]
MSTSTDAKKRHVCVHCDQEFKCDYPGCEKRSSRLDNLRAHVVLVFVLVPRHLLPTVATRIFHTPAAYSANETMSNSLQLFMPPPPPPRGDSPKINSATFPSNLRWPIRGASIPTPDFPGACRLRSAAPAAGSITLTVLALRCADAVFPIPFLVLRCANGAFPYPYATYPPDTRSPQYSSPQEQWYNWSFSQNNM